MGFLQALGVVLIIVSLFAGVGYWIIFYVRKTWPFLKFKISPPKAKEEDVSKLMQYAEANVDPIQLQIFLLTHNNNPKKTKEMVYLYSEIRKKMKGGVVK